MSKMTCVTCCGNHYSLSRTDHALQALRKTCVVTLLALQHCDQTGATVPVRRIESGTQREQPSSSTLQSSTDQLSVTCYSNCRQFSAEAYMTILVRHLSPTTRQSQHL